MTEDYGFSHIMSSIELKKITITRALFMCKFLIGHIMGFLKLFDPIMRIVKLSAVSVEVEDGYKIFKRIISSSYVLE